MGKAVLCITVDVEDADIESLRQIKEICHKHGAPVTWFVEPRLCREAVALDLLADYCGQGDEVGLHLHWKGSRSLGLRKVPIEQVGTELEEALQLLRPHFAVESFRGGGLCQTTPVLRIIAQKGFKFDSSVAHRLDQRNEWHQGHERILPLSAYHPSLSGYDVVARDDSGRLDILELPVTRGMPSPKTWCNMLEPGITPVGTMKLILNQYCIRRRYQPLVLMVGILHSYSPRGKKAMLEDLDKLLVHARSHNTGFAAISKAGSQWKEIWESQPAARDAILSHEFDLDAKSRTVAMLIRAAIFVRNLKGNPGYYMRAVTSRIRGGSPNAPKVT